MNAVIYYVLVAFFISILLGRLLIPILAKLKLGQHIREEGPQSHKKKAGTPTFGGLIFIGASVITMLIISRNYNNEAMAALYSLLAFGFIGFLDDSLKTIHKKNQGLTSKQKMILLLIAACFFTYYAYKEPSIGTSIIIPIKIELWDLKLFYIPLVIFFYACTTNAVNLTDGLDGLAATVTILVMVFFTIVSFCYGKYPLAIFCGIVSGSLLGFLRYNTYPARIIMGDTGALALGGTIATVAVILKIPLIVVVVGGIYVFETATTAIQIIAFKLTGKRVFRMTPIHHSFELKGWHEAKIVSIFSIATAILCIVGFLFLFP